MLLRVLAVALAAVLLVPSSALALEDDVSAAQEAKVTLLADYFAGDDADEADVAAAVATVTELRDLDIGWGALFKLLKLSVVLGVEPSELIGEPGPDGDIDFGFGELRKSLTEEELASYGDGAKNFGQLNRLTKGKAKAKKSA